MPQGWLRKGKEDRFIEGADKQPFTRPEWESARLLATAFREGRYDILALFDIIIEPEP